MAFREANLGRLVKFNSAASSDFIDAYEQHWENKIAAKNAEPKHKTFAPSSFRCPRVSWFRLRGVQPDSIPTPDKTLDFSAQVGTACHENIQRNLAEMLKADWIDVAEYLENLKPNYKYKVEKSGFETRIEIDSPPVRFACDGIIRWRGELYLLEIKTSEYSSFDQLTDPKSIHLDQIKFYASLLGLKKALVLYQDRTYGVLKCYEVTISQSDVEYVKNKIQYIIDMVDANLAPERLDRTDSWCSPNMCPYYKKCKEWG